jgi:hypothetical protein
LFFGCCHIPRLYLLLKSYTKSVLILGYLPEAKKQLRIFCSAKCAAEAGSGVVFALPVRCARKKGNSLGFLFIFC